MSCKEKEPVDRTPPSRPPQEYINAGSSLLWLAEGMKRFRNGTLHRFNIFSLFLSAAHWVTHAPPETSCIGLTRGPQEDATGARGFTRTGLGKPGFFASEEENFTSRRQKPPTAGLQSGGRGAAFSDVEGRARRKAARSSITSLSKRNEYL